MNEKQKANLTLLAEYLKELDPNIFYMRYHRTDNRGEYVEYINKDDCGTFGSALGWAPFVKGLEPIDSDYYYLDGKKLDLNFIKYSERVFRLDFDEWRWCFNGIWENTDNTPTGAAKRIMAVVNNRVPKNWEKQMYGNKPYMPDEPKPITADILIRKINSLIKGGNVVMRGTNSYYIGYLGVFHYLNQVEVYYSYNPKSSNGASYIIRLSQEDAERVCDYLGARFNTRLGLEEYLKSNNKKR